ncbi:MAG: hypothetical protein D6816_08300 [Bacteroidetes bacterium]|nr:MAG: hypothetical protein D6816_08300 [Bacteroidota bacterium]
MKEIKKKEIFGGRGTLVPFRPRGWDKKIKRDVQKAPETVHTSHPEIQEELDQIRQEVREQFGCSPAEEMDKPESPAGSAEKDSDD